MSVGDINMWINNYKTTWFTLISVQIYNTNVYIMNNTYSNILCCNILKIYLILYSLVVEMVTFQVLSFPVVYASVCILWGICVPLSILYTLLIFLLSQFFLKFNKSFCHISDSKIVSSCSKDAHSVLCLHWLAAHK